MLHIDSHTCDLPICLCPNMFIRVLIQQSLLVCFDLCSFKNKSFFYLFLKEHKFIFEEILCVVIIVLNPCFSCTCICNKITNNTCSTHIIQQQKFGFPNDIAQLMLWFTLPRHPTSIDDRLYYSTRKWLLSLHVQTVNREGNLFLTYTVL